MAAKKQPQPGIFDVAKPGRGGLPASSTTRPIIVSNRPLMRDPMMSEPKADEPAPEAPPAAKSSTKITIQPLHDTTVPESSPEPETTVEVEAPPKPPEGFPEPVPDAAAKPEDKPGVPPASDSQEQKIDTELARKHTARLQKMIEEEEYFLPIKTVEERRSRKVAIFGILLILLLVAAWYNTALDAGLLPNTYNLPHTSFFTVR